ncbi:MAG: arginine deiminase family protein [Gemmatimonadetes bacterium]|nr:arginine deiminase family protein [Gemmatimonadota bacterium]MCY3611885.1 arginine deiminase family protein [Gemmatimonadota bacterium]MCY3678471.1 arginine deiminase family protein [Gemmatimonadota bacterium]MYA43677.1 amidinotransferase [Gemmatimonadota bacterium]MYE94268.1 amidinotransferase [Gemmatimonadota bacterium]
MVAPLRRVAMRRPGRATLQADPVRWHYAGPLDGDRLARQYDAFAALVEASGAEIEWIPDADDGLADAIFVFDPSFMTPAGAVLLRPGKVLRRPEVGSHEALHARLAVPVVGAIEAPGTVEGGDLIWLDEQTLLVGRGLRTNQAGIEQLEAILAPLGAEVHSFDLPLWQGSTACLHLLSVISPLDHDLALVYPRLLPVALYQLLIRRGIRCLEASDEEFAASHGLNLNVLALGPRRCIAVGGFPRTVKLMRDAGCEVACFDADALCIACEGGPTCLTLPLWRG